MENPLDLLSRAATFIHDQMKSANAKAKAEESLRRTPPVNQHVNENDPSAHGDFNAKDLPTKSRKERRRKQAQDPFSKNKQNRRDSQIVKGNYIHDDSEEAPLDMSTGRRDLHLDLTNKPPPPSYAQSIADHGRPSVITCATLGRATSSSPSTPSASGDRSQKREFSSGVCDPVIDEHFRRSLGERYSHLFESSASTEEGNQSATTSPSSGAAKSPTVSVTGFSVDDHFAKALGETWLKLQNDESKDKEKTDSKPESPLTSKRHGLVII